jgi:hypothetical protein
MSGAVVISFAGVKKGSDPFAFWGSDPFFTAWSDDVAVQMQDKGIVRGVLREARSDQVVLEIPGTSYQLHLKSSATPQSLHGLIGKRVAGRIDAQSLRMHRAAAGGRFIEPIVGHPRIVQGAVRAIDVAGRRLLVDVAVPMWVTIMAGADPAAFAAGELVNFYVASGATFSPIATGR